MPKIPSSDVLAGGWAKLVYYTLGALHDFAYFGYITVQPLIFNRVLAKLAPFEKYSFEITIFVISTHLFWQVLLETPTGAYADSRGRMRAVREHFLIRVGCMLLLLLAIYLSANNQTTYGPWVVLGSLFLIEFGMATAEALLSGSFDAWLVDTLAASGEKDEAGETFSKAATLFNVAIFLAMPTFIYLVSFDGHETSYFVTGLAAVVFVVGAMVAHASRREVYRMGSEWAERSKATIKNTWQDGLNYLWSDRIVWWTTLLRAAPFAAWVVISWFWPLLVKYTPGAQASAADPASTGKLLVALAFALAIFRILGSTASYFVQRLTGSLAGLLSGTVFNLLMAFVAGLSLVYVDRSLLDTFTGFSTQPSSPLLTPALFFGAGLVLAKGSEEVVKVLNQIFLAHYVQSDTVRATVISFTEAVTSLIGFILINLGLIITWGQQPQHKAPLLLLSVASSGVILAIIAGVMLRRLLVRVPVAVPQAGD